MSLRAIPAEHLRGYQREILRAVGRSVADASGHVFSVEIARQGGKNEVSAFLEWFLLYYNWGRGTTIVKAAPTLRPQARNSLRRLHDSFARFGELDDVRVSENTLYRGPRRAIFLSAARTANVVGMTADLLLEIDESQDVLPEKYQRDFRPMASSTNATTVHYGTAWQETSLLETIKQQNLALERAGGPRLHFRYDWETIAAYNPDYGRFVESERNRLGAGHPLFLTQYALVPLGRAGRLFDGVQLDQLRGRFQAASHPEAGETYVAGLDLAGEEQDGGIVLRQRDSAVLTIAALRTPPFGSLREDGGAPVIAVVRWYQWTGQPVARLVPALVDLLGTVWRCQRVVVDATGVGQPVASLLRDRLGLRVRPLTFTQRSKSDLGYQLLAAVNAGRLKAPAGDEAGDALAAEFWLQCRLARRHFQPNQTMQFHVDPADGHDDFVTSLALAVEAANGALPRTARGRSADRT